MNALEKHVLRIIGEDVDNPDVFDEVEGDHSPGIGLIRDSINDGIQELCMVTGSYQKTYLLPLYADRAFYRMAWEQDYFGWVTEVWDRARNRRLTQTDVMSLSARDDFWLRRTGDPDEYMQIGEDIFGVFYKPSANGIVLEVQCACIPKPYVNDTDEVKVREVFQKAAVYMAVSEFYASRGNAPRAAGYLNNALETAGLMVLHPAHPERTHQMGGYRNDRRYPQKAIQG